MRTADDDHVRAATRGKERSHPRRAARDNLDAIQDVRGGRCGCAGRVDGDEVSQLAKGAHHRRGSRKAGALPWVRRGVVHEDQRAAAVRMRPRRQDAGLARALPRQPIPVRRRKDLAPLPLQGDARAARRRAAELTMNRHGARLVDDRRAADPDADAVAEQLLGPYLDGAIDIVHVGSVEARKRVDLLLQVFAGIHREFPNVRLIRVGGGLLPQHREMALALGIERVLEVPTAFVGALLFRLAWLERACSFLVKVVVEVGMRGAPHAVIGDVTEPLVVVIG